MLNQTDSISSLDGDVPDIFLDCEEEEFHGFDDDDADIWEHEFDIQNVYKTLQSSDLCAHPLTGMYRSSKRSIFKFVSVEAFGTENSHCTHSTYTAAVLDGSHPARERD